MADFSAAHTFQLCDLFASHFAMSRHNRQRAPPTLHLLLCSARIHNKLGIDYVSVDQVGLAP